MKENKTFGDFIRELRKEKGLTQKELANKLNITDKPVSKWERNLSYPDIMYISKLAQILGVKSSHLIDLCKNDDNSYRNKVNIREFTDIILKSIGLGMGVTVFVLSILGEMKVEDAIILLGFGLACVCLSLLLNIILSSHTNSN